jgi:hypothetical protein
MDKFLQEQREVFEKEFDNDYDINNVDEWTLGIIASILMHARMSKFGEDASYLTEKLRRLVSQELTKERERIVAMVEGMKMARSEYKYEDMYIYKGGYNQFADDLIKKLL